MEFCNIFRKVKMAGYFYTMYVNEYVKRKPRLLSVNSHILTVLNNAFINFACKKMWKIRLLLIMEEKN